MGSNSLTPASGVFSVLIALQQRSERTREELPNLTDEQLKELFAGLEGATSIAWQLQADVIHELQSRARYGSNAIAELSKFLEIPQRRAFELSQIAGEIFSKAPELRESSLEKGHYLVALRAKGKGKNPVEVLEYAIDNNLGVRDLKGYIDGIKKSDSLETHHYEIRRVNISPDDAEKAKQLRYFSAVARLVEINGKMLLEHKE